MKTKKDLVPAIATHPGEIIQDELDAREMNQAELALLIGMEKSQLNDVIKGKRSINADTAVLLEKALGIDADYWMSAQKNYELDLARINAKNQARIQSIEEWNIWKGYVPVDFFKKSKLITGDPIYDVEAIKKIYGYSHVEQFAATFASPVYVRYKQGNAKKADRVNILGWTKLISYLGEQQKVTVFNQKHKAALLMELRKVIAENKNVKEAAVAALANAGIKLVFHKNADKCPVDGVCMWNGKNPLIGMSLRYSRLDNFAFTLFHELGHVYLHLVNDPQAQFVDDLDNADQRIDQDEIEANEFASNNLIAPKEWERFMGNSNRMQDEFAVLFAAEIGIHPAVVKGRLKFEFKDYALRTRIDNSLS
jgi:HTH-type transcriptional regulator / antitoxin HigA